MRTYFLLFFLVLSMACGFSQSDKSVKINAYIQTLKEFQKDKKFKAIKYLNDQKFRVIVKKLYEAIEIAPVELVDTFIQDHNR